MNLPYVSCICPTYGRFPEYSHLLAEAVQSFLLQDYPFHRRELLIANDCADQLLECNVPQVRVLNLHFRHETLGGKYNAACELAGGDFICPWEDDDVSLPWRISTSVSKVIGGSYWNPQYSWYMDSNGLHADHAHGVCHNASIFSRAAWRAVGGYPRISGAQDAQMDARLKSLKSNVFDPLVRREQWFYVYRFSVSPCHVSGAPNHDQFYQDWGTRPVQRGAYKIEPMWQRDYVALTR